MIFVKKGDLEQDLIVATKENSRYLCAGKPLRYFLRGKEDLVHELGKAVRLKIALRLELIGYQDKVANGEIEDPQDSFEGCSEDFKDDAYGDPITYVRVGDIKPALEDFNQNYDGLLAEYIFGLPEDTIIILCWY
ncbi:MAG: hypothetical protein ACYC8S_01500 [Minisyncoccota bacterium]